MEKSSLGIVLSHCRREREQNNGETGGMCILQICLDRKNGFNYFAVVVGGGGG